MKKGFTLVELLAAIIILVVILIIAIPQVLKVINNSRTSAYIKNEQMVINVTDLYLSKNMSRLPQEIGETTEVSINELVTEGFLTEIKNPYNKNEDCTGYILITKIGEKSFDYIPHLKCGLDIHNRDDDGLLVHYKFDDFQEPTENLLRNVIDTSFESYSKSGWSVHNNVSFDIVDEILYDNRPVIKLYPNPSGPGGIHATTSQFVSEGTTATMSMKIYIPATTTLSSNWEIHRHALPDGQCLGGSCHHYTDLDITNKDWNDLTKRNKWIHRDVVIRASDNEANNGYRFRMFMYANAANEAGNYVYMTNPQIELKPYSTPFTKDIREGIVRDYSGNEKDVELQLDSTPRWLYNDYRNSGVYKFNGNDTLINLHGKNLNLPSTYDGEATVSMWIKPNKHSNPIARYIAGFHYWSINSSGRLQNMVRKPSEGINYWLFGNQVIPIEEWTHIVYMIKENEYVRYYLNGQLDSYHNSSSLGINNYSSNSAIGASYNNYFDGKIDDVRIYNRVLSEQEIKILYETSK